MSFNKSILWFHGTHQNVQCDLKWSSQSRGDLGLHFGTVSEENRTDRLQNVKMAYR